MMRSRFKDPIIVTTSSSSDDDDDETEDCKGCQFDNNASNQLVLYDPRVNGTSATEPVQAPPQLTNKGRCSPSVVIPSVGSFTVQCASCFKWRLIPTKEKYEEIREHIIEQPFFCETACEWRPEISCDDPEDISQDDGRLWAIDKPNIAQPPPGWKRELRIRGEGGTKFADIYYVAPSGKVLRSIVEIEKFLLQHPDYIRDGVTLSQFSFQIPKPLQKDYVRKRRAGLKTSPDRARAIESGEVKPISCLSPEDGVDLQNPVPALPAPCEDDDDPDVYPALLRSTPSKKQATNRSIRRNVQK